MKPVAFSTSQFHHPKLIITLDGQPVRKCFNVNEAEGWADVWSVNEQGKTYRIEGTRTPASERRYGVVTAECPPEIRAFLERLYAVEVVV